MFNLFHISHAFLTVTRWFNITPHLIRCSTSFGLLIRSPMICIQSLKGAKTMCTNMAMFIYNQIAKISFCSIIQLYFWQVQTLFVKFYFIQSFIDSFDLNFSFLQIGCRSYNNIVFVCIFFIYPYKSQRQGTCFN